MVGHALQNAGERRVILLTVDERPTSDKVMDWAVANMYRPGDVFHILHVIAPPKQAAMAPDFTPDVLGEDIQARCEVEAAARAFIKERFETRLIQLHIPYKVEVARSCVDCDSIGELLCKRADKLNAAVLLMAKHKRGALKEFFIGSVSNYALHHCKQPVLVLQVQ